MNRLNSKEINSPLFLTTRHLIFSQQSQRKNSLIINQIRSDKEIKGLIVKSLFSFLFPIGRGAYGKVWIVELRQTKKLFALKEMQKLRILTKRSVSSVINERNILESLKSPFIVNMHYAFQDKDNLYLVLDLKHGGDLRYQMSKFRKFKEDQVKFFTCCVLLGLQYVHSQGVIHRDIKPENLVFDKNGYLYITDFGISKIWKPDNKGDYSGTPGYMAPEVINKQSHSFSVDFYALGITLFELITGKRPYLGRRRREIREEIIVRQAKIRQPPENWSQNSVDFVNQLIQRRPYNRLGNSGIEEIIKHPWLSEVNWEKIKTQQAVPQFVPIIRESFDPKACSEFKDEIDTSIDLANCQRLFINYNFDSRNLEKSPRRKSLISLT